MAVENAVFNKLREAITPVISIGVGSAIISVCNKVGLDPHSLEEKDVPIMKEALLEHYKKFWESKLDQIKGGLDSVL